MAMDGQGVTHAIPRPSGLADLPCGHCWCPVLLVQICRISAHNWGLRSASHMSGSTGEPLPQPRDLVTLDWF